MPNSQRGSEWRRWDLHVHTPKSIVQEYGGDNEDAWEAYITALEALPSDVKVLGINDYIFIDGYEKVLEYKNSGRLPNIDLILPVIELRVDKFVGNTDLNRINYHVIFSDDVSVATIKSQFIASLSSSAKLDPDVDNVTWNGVVDEQSLTDLGQLIYDNAPDESKPTDTHKVIGFNNINFSLDAIKELLRTNTYLKDHITAIGKSEWDSFRWTGSASDKKTIINSTDLVFTASPSSEDANKHIETLTNQGVNCKVIHSSDAHKVADDTSNTQPRDIGHCFTWVKADTTFNGLKQVLYDYSDRVRLQQNSPYDDDIKYVLDKILIKKDGVLQEQEIPVNRDLVSIIGSKGSGKSLLLSAISSVSDLADYDPDHKHPIFDDGDNTQLVDFELLDKGSNGVKKEDIELSIGKDEYYTEPVLYVAQEELAGRSKNKKNVRDEYLRELGIDNLSISYQDITDDTEYNLDQIDSLTNDLNKITKSVDQNVSSDKVSEYLEKKIKSLEQTNEKLSNAQTKKVIEELSTVIAKGQEATLWHKDDGFKDIELLAQDMNSRVSVFNAKAKTFDIPEADLLPLVDVDELKKAYEKSSVSLEKKLEDLRKQYGEKKEELEQLGVSEDIPTLLKTVENIQREIATNKKYLDEVKALQENIPVRQTYVGDLFKSDAIIHKRISEIEEDINKKFDTFKSERKSSPIFEKLFKSIDIKANVFFDFKKLEADIVECFYKDRLTVKDLHKIIFDGKEPTYEAYFEWIESSFWNFLSENIKGLKVSTSSGLSGLVRLRQVVLLDWYEYVSVSVNITHKFGDTLKELSIMSTGELATVLLKLILVTQGLDKQIILLDQPEDHLDNEFIANDLVELIRELKKKRQIIMVTHNANLVVMTDSEQVIVANGIDKEYLSGGIEKSEIRDSIVRILEGGAEAFKKRYKRYGTQ
ncbi:MAG TPA: hypothetical protein PK543_00800 [Candidatus Saccharibacteria bacterium]|nr:hypothetical protein [Candidatus Saccharibacteria bacterium]